MKRWIILALVLALALSVMVVPAFAAERRGGFVDADNNGICDNYSETGCSMQGAGFADADNDGVCDNYTQMQGGCRRGMGNGAGRGCCRNAG